MELQRLVGACPDKCIDYFCEFWAILVGVPYGCNLEKYRFVLCLPIFSVVFRGSEMSTVQAVN